jgi:hypothetical protein
MVNDMKNKLHPVFVSLFSNDTEFGKLIKKVTNQEYSHATISVDSTMNHMYSFGNVPMSNAVEPDSFVVESIYSPAYIKNLYFDVYAVFLTEEELNKLKANVAFFEEHQEKFYYSNKGLIEYFFGKKNTKNLTHMQKKKKNSWFCSEFVAYMLKTADEAMVKNTMLSPGDLVNEPYVHWISKYTISTFDSKDLDKKAKKVQAEVEDSAKKNNPLTESSVTSMSDLVTPDKKIRFYRKDENDYVPIYVILTRNNTLVGNTIANLSRSDYNHASLSLSADLTHMYSFAGKDNFKGGFVREDITSPGFQELIHDKKLPSRYALYVTFVSKKKYQIIKEKLDNIIVDVDRYTYNFKQLFKLPLGIKNSSENSYICSEFVGMLLSLANPDLISKHHSLLTPMDVVKNEKFYLVSSGELKDYSYKHTLKEVNSLVKGKKLYKLLSESTYAANYLYYKDVMDSDVIVNQILHNFYPTTVLEPLPLFSCANGGLFFSEDDIVEYGEEFEAYYDTGKNIYGADLSEDTDHVKYCMDLYNVYMMLFLKEGGLEILKNNEERNGILIKDHVFSILNQWSGRVSRALELLRDSIDKDEEEINKCKQRVVDLMWSTKCRMQDDLIPAYKYNFALRVGFVHLPSTDDMTDIENVKVNFGYINKVAHDIFLTTDGRYPVFDQNSLISAAHSFDEDEIDADHFLEKWLYFYRLLDCKFKIGANTIFAKYMQDRSVIDEYDYRMSITS